MPEGDSIFRLAAKLRPWLVGEVLRRVDFPTKALSGEKLEGRKVVAIETHGKNLLVRVEDGSVLHVHLRMTGRVRLGGVSREAPAARSASFVLETARARVVGTNVPVVRVLSAAMVRRDPMLRALGPDLLHEGFDPERAVAGLRARAELGIGEALLDQRALAGLGNVYKSELLFRHKLDPFTRVRDLDDAMLRALVDDGVKLLRWNADRQARGSRERITRTSGPRSPTGQSVYGRARRPCFDCGTLVRAAEQGGRVTYFCPTCQGVP